MLSILGYVLWGAFYLLLFIGIIYLLSRIMMRGWIQELELFLGSRLGSNLTINKNENETKEEE